MEQLRFIRAAGVAAIAGGVCVVAVLALLAVFEQVWLLIPVAALLLVVAFWGARRLLTGGPASAGSAAVWLMTLGVGLFFILSMLGAFAELVLGRDPEDVYPAWLEVGFPIGGVLLALGLLIFGIAGIVGGLPKVPFLLLLLFLPLTFGIDALTGNVESEEGVTPGFYAGFSVLAIGLLWLGTFLRSHQGSRAEESTGESS